MTQDTSLATPKYLVEVRKNIFSDNFADGVADSTQWSEDTGTWAVSQQTQYDGDTGYVYGQSNTAADYLSYYKKTETLEDYYFVAAFKILTASGKAGLVFRKTDSTYYCFAIEQGSANNLYVEKEDGTPLGSGGITSITPLVSSSNTQESTSQTTLQNTDVSISGTSLQNGVDYLVMYCAAFGGNDTSAEVEVTVEHGSTVIARAIGEGSSTGTPESMRIKSIHGYYIITGDGSSDLRIKYRCITSFDTAYIKGKTLIAIPLNDLTENTDYWQTTQNGDTNEITNAATDFSTNLITLTKTLPEDGNYLVLMSAEVLPDITTAAGKCRFSVGGVAQKIDFETEGEATGECNSFSYAKVHNLTAGSTTFKIDVASELGTNDADARRGRIIVIKANSFDQLVSSSDTAGSDTTSTTYVDYLSKTYTPNQQEYVVVIGNAAFWQTVDYRSSMMRLYNDTDATAFSDQISADSADMTNDRHSLTAFGCEQISSAKTYKLQYAGESPGPHIYVDEGDLIVWGLSKGSGGGSTASATINQNTWHMARVRVSGSSIKCDISSDFVNFTEKLDLSDSSYSEGTMGLKTFQTSAYFDAVELYELEKTITETTNEDLVEFETVSATSNEADTFSLSLKNVDGANVEPCGLGNEVHVWAGYAENSPDLNKIFVGVIEDPIPSLNDVSGDTLSVSGTDLTVELLSQPVTEVYYNKDVDWIVKDLISKYCENVTAGVNVAATNNVQPRIAFIHKPLIDCLRELAKIGDGSNTFDFWIDLKKDLHFQPKGTTDSGKTLEVGVNILDYDFGPSLGGVYSKVAVYGKGKQDTNNVVQQTTSDESGSFGKTTTYQKLAQTFVLNKTELFDVVVKPQTSTGSPTADIVFEIQEVDGSSLPNGHVLATYIVKSEDWEQAISDGEDITLALDCGLEPAGTYALVVYTKENVLSDTDYYNLAVNSAGGYTDGARLYYNGTTWGGAADGKDLYFKLYPRLPNIFPMENTTVKSLYKINRVYEDFGKRDSIRSREEAKARAERIYADKTTVPYEGSITTFGMDDVRAGQKIRVKIPNTTTPALGIDNNYEIIKLTNSLNKSGYISTVYLNTRMETITDILADQEKRIRALETKDLTEHEETEDAKTLQDEMTLTNDPGNNLFMFDRTVNSTNTWFFGKPHAFNEPIKFGGGSGKYGSNQITGASD